MSRSHHQKSCGRGCGVCGDAGEVRRGREEDARRADEIELLAESEAPRTKCACGNPLSNAHDDEHPGRCCDCFDASMGAPRRVA